MDEVDRQVVNVLQDGFPVSERPYADVAERLGLGEEELIARVGRLCAEGYLSRFGPLYNAERLGGAVTLAALSAPADDFDRIAALVNAHPEVAHNYAREHALNMWFVLATEHPARIDEVVAEIEAETGLAVLTFPKLQEYFIGLRLEA